MLLLLVEGADGVRRGRRLILLDEWRGLGDVLAEDVALDEVRQPHGGLVVDVRARGDREDLVDLLECELFSFL